MTPDLLTQHHALEALADPITPWPASAPAGRRAGAWWPVRWFASVKRRRKRR